MGVGVPVVIGVALGREVGEPTGDGVIVSGGRVALGTGVDSCGGDTVMGAAESVQEVNPSKMANKRKSFCCMISLYSHPMRILQFNNRCNSLQHQATPK